MKIRQLAISTAAAASIVPAFALGQDNATMDEVVVRGHKINLVGEASSASEGVVSQEEIAIRPLLRTGEVLETVPGLVATQHSGPGKANQFYLRGFNLDHGTDFSTIIDDMPVNMRTHGHGQGYTDLNFIIPELVGQIAYQKGSYYPAVGDFSGTGTARMGVLDRLDGHTLKVGSDFGRENWRRVLATGQTPTSANSSLLYGVEWETTDGHWDDVDTDVDRKNLWLRQQWGTGGDRFALTFMGYDNSWNSADQIPQRAVDQGLITEFGSVDTTTGGESSRYSLSASWDRDTAAGQWHSTAYVIDYEMELFSNFTYFLEPGGDQFAQLDDRRIYGWELAWSQNDEWGGLDVRNTFGSQMRYDDIAEVGLYGSRAREIGGAIRSDAVDEWSVGLYWENEISWSERFRTVSGLRYDYYDFRVKPLEASHSPSLDVNGGNSDADIVTASTSFIYTLSDSLETYASVGQGFHSNDARGTTIRMDPVSGDPMAQVDPLVDTLGYELGLRGYWDSLNASIALWALDIDSELIFVGDAGGTEDTGVGSERYGIEATAYYYLNDAWTFDLEYAWSHARFEHKVDGHDEVPGALEHVLSAGVNTRWTPDFYSNLRVRHFGEYPLDGGMTADASTIVNLRLGYDLTENLALSFDVLNLLDSDDRDIQYYYESRLPGEPAPVEDYHFHIFEPRAYHLTMEYRF
ncbi:TonB-dependent receptor [Gilvimarinus sp. F26214L]|uniref:TonB-dependent receptor n=1 Tax=Gilvimarinus sp. DZF01 TaxID=3461371 RepID=UPI004045C19E